MRISDWSSDVCSSDLERAAGVDAAHHAEDQGDRHDEADGPARQGDGVTDALGQHVDHRLLQHQRVAEVAEIANPAGIVEAEADGGIAESVLRRSEEHTSELQSLMRISYAVFCLKKKKTKNN